jgi:hypothetical protein
MVIAVYKLPMPVGDLGFLCGWRVVGINIFQKVQYLHCFTIVQVRYKPFTFFVIK